MDSWVKEEANELMKPTFCSWFLYVRLCVFLCLWLMSDPAHEDSVTSGDHEEQAQLFVLYLLLSLFCIFKIRISDISRIIFLLL